MVEAFPVRDGVQLTIVVAGADTKTATRLGKATLFINFTRGVLAYDAAEETAWKEKLELPKDGEGSMKMTPQGGSPSLWGVPAHDLQMTAIQVSDRNLLKRMPVPR